MNADLQQDLLDAFDEFDFKAKGGWLRRGKCPQCGERELYTNADHPWVLKCGRLNRCGYEEHVKARYPELFEDWSKRTREEAKTNPDAAADAYLSIERGFNLERIKGWYRQEAYFDPEADNGRGATSATVRFPVGTAYWERLIDRPGRFDKKAHFRKGSSFKGMWWQPQGRDFARATEIWIPEGIFNAIALDHHELLAASNMSSSNYPGAALDAIAEECKGRSLPRPTLVWAQDNDKAGREYMLRHVRQAEKAGWTCKAALVPQTGRRKLDWNDLHQLGKLDGRMLEECRYQGDLLLAKSALDKGLLIYRHDGRHEFHFDFENSLYWFKLDLDAYHKEIQELQKEGRKSDEEQPAVIEQALLKAHAITRIAECVPTPLYYLANRMTDEAWYYLRIVFAHEGPEVKATFTASHLSSATDFGKRLLHVAPGAMYSGTSLMLRRMLQKQLFNIPRVETIDYVGYTAEHKAYVFNKLAVQDGRVYKANDDDYFELNRLQIKSLMGLPLSINPDLRDYSDAWVRLLWTAYGAKGFVALAYWLGTLFAEQIRAAQQSYPFLEMCGEAGTGKTTLLEFFWKLLGRVGYEGFDFVKASVAGRNRALAQVSNLPTVLIEGDRGGASEDKGPHVRQFDFDELKPMYNGRGIRARGVADGSNATLEPPFRSSIVIAQNAAVQASEAILSRIVHMRWTRAHHSPEGLAAGKSLAAMPIEQVSGWLIKALASERAVLQKVLERAPVHEKRLLDKVKMVRIATCHGQIAALAEALRLVVRIEDWQFDAVMKQIDAMAIERQAAINTDHPMVVEFWEAFEYLDGGATPVNHSRKDDTTVAVNLNHFAQVARQYGQNVPLLTELKKHLPTSRRYKFIGTKNVNSALKEANALNKSSAIWCWVFERPAEDRPEA
ncbi:toprim domain-containing protein [Azohydromonas lata]|uniref:Toprim domain-containing protein n=1 Tax=Azohydromonas lata TaxID=45677 RepID=A0ABU5IG99_9BURK|nr:toprim domain-containing protein [Azohydromonas lata]MDZ5456978.1 toprim domain-containing protein [Azohydromonas lata]